MMERLRAMYRDDEEEDEWGDALDRQLPPPSPPPPPPLPISNPSHPDAMAGAAVDSPLRVAAAGSSAAPEAAQLREEEQEMGGTRAAGVVPLEGAVKGGGGRRLMGEEHAREEQKEMGRGRRIRLGKVEDVEEDEEEEEDGQEEGEDEEEEEEGLEEERAGGGQPSTPLSPLLPSSNPKFTPRSNPRPHKRSKGGYYEEDDDEEGNEEEDDDSLEAAMFRRPKKKQKSLNSLTTPSSPSHIASVAILSGAANEVAPPAGSSTARLDASAAAAAKKSKKKSNNVWKKSSSRKSKKKGKSGGSNHLVPPEDKVLITPIPRFPDKSDDSPDATICLSRVYKAEKVEISEDRLTASSTKGYRMARATRGVVEGAWYYEINVVRLGETGHTRLGWTTEKGDLQAPVGYDVNSFGYRDIDGTKIHKALREKYGDESYGEGDVVGFYINLPDGASYAPKPPQYVWYKGQRYMYSADGKDEPSKVVPGSEISFFKNGICQGTAFTDLFGGRYYPAASMYTLPNQPNCEVRFNFGPNFKFFPEDFGGRPIPKPMIEVPYHGYSGKGEVPGENGVSEKKQVNGTSL